MKKAVLFLAFVFILASVSAADLDIEKIERSPTIISELNEPAMFDFIITNYGPADSFEIYSLVGVTFFPSGNFNLPTGKTTLAVSAFPREEIRAEPGVFRFAYEIKNRGSEAVKDTLSIKVVSIKDTLEIKTKPIKPTDTEATIYITNKEKAEIKNLQIEFSSIFFEGVKQVSLGPEKNTTIKIPINKEFDKKTRAGNYIMTSTIVGIKGRPSIESPLTFLEKSGISTEESKTGIVVQKSIIIKTNDGNIPAEAEVTLTKDFLSRLFTTNSPSPDKTQRNGISVTYSWKKNLNPAESLVVTSSTNYTVPLILLLLVVVVTYLVKNYSRKVVLVEKHVHPVKTKGGEFALKVTLRVKARKHVDGVQLIDSLPSMTKLFDKFGKMPDRFDAASNRMFWNISSLRAGEERVYTYIMYSKINIVGRFELPAATAVFNHEGKNEESFSSRVVFAREI